MSVINAVPLLAAAGGDYQISRSVRLRSSASAYFNRTPASAGNRQKWTWSGWVKRGTLTRTYLSMFAATPTVANQGIHLGFDASVAGDNIVFSVNAVGTASSLAKYRDPSAWYHIILAFDSTQAVAADRAKLYVNGVQQSFDSTPWSLNASYAVNNTVAHYHGYTDNPSAAYFDGYLSEINFVDGQQLTPSSFGETDAVTGVWKPKKYAGTYGTNGFYLNFSDNSAATAAAIGKDSSGNGNNWTPNNISVTAGVTYDSMIDTPTPYADGGNGRGNYAVLNPLSTGLTITSGNLAASSGAAHRYATATIIPQTGKWYWEYTLGSTCSGSVQMSVGVGKVSSNFSVGTNPTTNGTQLGIYLVSDNGSMDRVVNGSSSGASATTVGSAGSIYQIAFDADNGKMYFGVNNTFYSSTMTTTGNPSSGTNETINGLTGELFAPLLHHYANSSNLNFGQRPFTYTPPTGFKALNTQNLPDSTIKKGNQYFDATTYTGNGSTQSIVNAGGFQPDLVWVKGRSGATNNALYDASRGANTVLFSDSTLGDTAAAALTAFNSNGFAVNYNASYAFTNTNAATYVGWQWNAGGNTVSNTSGSITSSVRANATAGFSVVTYTGISVPGTVGHGLGVAPKLVIVKARSGGTSSWAVWHTALTGNEYLLLESTAAKGTASTVWNGTTPTSSVFSVGSGSVPNTSGWTYVAYCWSEVAGYSKFGSYVGNGSADGAFVYLGFRAKWIMVKDTTSSSAGAHWFIWDSSRNTYNLADNELIANNSVAENGADPSAVIDVLSNGFKFRGNTYGNVSGATNIYAAFAESPFRYALGR